MTDYCRFCHADTEDDRYHACTCADCGAPRSWWSPELIGVEYHGATGGRVAYWADAVTATRKGYVGCTTYFPMTFSIGDDGPETAIFIKNDNLPDAHEVAKAVERELSRYSALARSVC